MSGFSTVTFIITINFGAFVYEYFLLQFCFQSREIMKLANAFSVHKEEKNKLI